MAGYLVGRRQAHMCEKRAVDVTSHTPIFPPPLQMFPSFPGLGLVVYTCPGRYLGIWYLGRHSTLSRYLTITYNV